MNFARFAQSIGFFAWWMPPADLPKPPEPLPVPIEARPLSDWDAKFSPKDGWIGGDGAYSVDLTRERTLWLFSDTFVGKVRDGKRTDATMVNNTIGIQDGHGEKATVRFVVRKGSDGKLSAMITPADGKGWFWLHAGVCFDGKLYLFLAQIERAGEGAFGFRHIAEWLGIVSNPLAEPTEWRIEQKKVPFADFSGDRFLYFGAGLLRDGKDIYVYGIDETQKKGVFPNKQLIIARVAGGSIADFSSWRFYRDGEWETDFRKVSHPTEGLANELSVSFLPNMKKYALVYTEFGMSDKIVARIAETPVGPWSASTTLYRCPEAQWEKRIFCYAAKAHPSEANGDELIITYAANSFDFWHVLTDARLYWPKFVRVRWGEK